MKKILFMLLGIILLQGCKKDFLDTKPRDSYSNATIWGSQGDAVAALNGVYNGWESGGNIIYRDCMSDNAYNQFPWEGYEKFASGVATSADPGVDAYDYGTIQRANWFLDNIDKVPSSSLDDPLKNRMKGEARFIRAYSYFILSQYYGNVPFADHAVTTEEANAALQTPKDKIVDFILKELAEIAPLLPVSYDTEIGRITRGAALALKARTELYEGKFPDCISTCRQLMTSPFNYSIYPSFENLFRPQYVDASGNKEVILTVQNLINNNAEWSLVAMAPNSQGGWSSIAPTQALVDAYETINGKTIDQEDSAYDPKQPYKNRDPRLDQGIIRPGLLWMGKYFDPYTKGGLDLKGGNNASPTGYNFKKYIANVGDYKNTSYGTNINNTGGSFIVIRYAEVLLTYAEAKIEANQIDASVYDAINRVRRRESVRMPEVTPAQYPDPISLRALVRRERRVELCGEGLRWFDIKRWKISPIVMNAEDWGSPNGTVNPTTGEFTWLPRGSNEKAVVIRKFADKNYLLPIPYQQLTINRNLVQNPGY